MGRSPQAESRPACREPVSGGLAAWYGSALGQRLEAVEIEALDEVLTTLFGYHLLLVAPPWSRRELPAARIPHRMVLGWNGNRRAAALLARPHRLPLATDALDAIVLPHTLECSTAPHELLREVDRCLVPEGQVVLFGFNPFGWWGLARLAAGWRGRPPWCLRFIGQRRIRDWLTLLGFEVTLVRPLFFRPPLAHGGVLDRLGWLERLGQHGWPLPAATHLIVARKRVVGLTPLRPRWRPRRGFVVTGAVGPTQRTGGR